MVEGNLVQFAVLLGVLGLSALISLTLRLPIVPLYIAAGLVLGRLFAPDEVVNFLGSLGVVFLLFSMGLEFSIGSVRRAPLGFLRLGAIDWLVNFPIGLAVGLALGWSWIESLFLAGIVYMSSSAVVARCITDFGRAARPETETILKILIFEDLAIAVFLVLMNTLAPGAEAHQATLLDQALAFARAILFVGLLALLLYRFQDGIERTFAARSEEGFTLVLFSFVLLIASAAITAGLSEAVGAFLAGLVVGGTRLKKRAARTLQPHQMLFAALFFVSFGMQLDLGSFGDAALPALLLILLGLGTKTLGGFLAGRSAGHRRDQALVVGLSLIPKGEFSIVLAGLAVLATEPGSMIQTVTGLYVFVLSILGPIAMREADRVRQAAFGTRGAAPEPEADRAATSVAPELGSGSEGPP